jgi:dipeptidyl aminopeptidase/acylaminoacyl peptidase
MNPRISPDGRTLAFLTFVGQLTQVALMKPDTGNWTVLTSNSAQGGVRELSWSHDGTRIYFDRKSGVPQGVFVISVSGGDEHLVLQDAENPQALPDGSLLVLRSNAERRERLFLYWPETGKLHPFPVEILKSDVRSIPIRVFPDGRNAVMVGRPILPGPYPSNLLLLLVDLVLGGVRVIDSGDPPVSLAIAPGGKSLLAGNISGDVSTFEMPALGAPRRRPLAGPVHPMHMDIGPDGSLYADAEDGSIVAPAPGFRSSLWRFQEVSRAKGRVRRTNAPD